LVYPLTGLISPQKIGPKTFTQQHFLFKHNPNPKKRGTVFTHHTGVVFPFPLWVSPPETGLGWGFPTHTTFFYTNTNRTLGGLTQHRTRGNRFSTGVLVFPPKPYFPTKLWAQTIFLLPFPQTLFLDRPLWFKHLSGTTTLGSPPEPVCQNLNPFTLGPVSTHRNRFLTFPVNTPQPEPWVLTWNRLGYFNNLWAHTFILPNERPPKPGTVGPYTPVYRLEREHGTHNRDRGTRTHTRNPTFLHLTALLTLPFGPLFLPPRCFYTHTGFLFLTTGTPPFFWDYSLPFWTGFFNLGPANVYSTVLGALPTPHLCFVTLYLCPRLFLGYLFPLWYPFLSTPFSPHLLFLRNPHRLPTCTPLSPDHLHFGPQQSFVGSLTDS